MAGVAANKGAAGWAGGRAVLELSSRRGRWRSLGRAVVHLRLHFQAILAPIFLWGVVLAGSRPDWRTWLVFFAYHVGLYGGATAYNSAYDKDSGPVGGLRRPPPVDPFLLPWSLGVLGAGWLLSLARPATAGLYAVILVMAVAYSHPAVRLKGRPLASLLTIAVGQGLLPFFAGLLATPAPRLQPALWSLAADSAALVAVAFYPLTQLYQIEEDRARGDRTAAVAWGVDRCFRLAALLLLAAAAVTTATVALRFGAAQGALVLAFYGGLLAGVRWWRARFSRWDMLQNYRAAMRFTVVGAGGFGLYLVAQLLLAYA